MSKLHARILLPVLAAFVALAIGAGLAVAKSTGGSALPSGTYKIGFVESKTGRLAFYDPPFYQGLKLGIDQINAKGGVGGKLKLAADHRRTARAIRRRVPSSRAI